MFVSGLTAWYRANRRFLPWREETDAYRIWVSEIILQQTRVQQGLDYYTRFTGRFPDIRSLAEADEQEVLKYWQGLGYYTRARNLHAGARWLWENYGGKFPDTYEEILKIKGVGTYTAAAIASFAFKLPYPVVDGNVLRVVSRLFGVEAPVDTAEGRKAVEDIVKRYIPKDDPALFNQAMMDFGALQCVPRNPDCSVCPFAGNCQAESRGLQAELPYKQHRTRQTDRYFWYWVFRRQGGVYLHRREGKDIWKGLYEFPLTESVRPLTEAQAIESQPFVDASVLRAQQPLRVSGEYRHVLSHQVLHARFAEVQLPENAVLPGLLFAGEKLPEYPLPRLMEKYLSGKCG